MLSHNTQGCFFLALNKNKTNFKTIRLLSVSLKTYFVITEKQSLFH